MRLRPGLWTAALCPIMILSGCQPASDWRWQPAENGLPRQAVILTLAADPNNPNHLWGGYYAPGGLAISHDGGQTWTTSAQGLADNPVFDLLPLPAGPLWAATRDGLMESSDGGMTWTPELAGLPSASAFALAAGRDGRVYVGMDDFGLYVQAPGKDGWISLNQNERLATAAVLSLAVSPGGTQLYAGTAGRGLFASQDAGSTWTVAFSNSYIPNLALSPSHPGTAVASLRDRLARTQDGGRSWELLPTPWARHEVTSLLWLADSRAEAAPQLEASETILAGNGQGQIYCSPDGGDSWLEMEAPTRIRGGVLALMKNNDQLLAGTWTGIYASPAPVRCANGHNTWTYISPSLGTPYANAFVESEAGLLIGTRTGLFRWQPAVRHWIEVALEDIPVGGVAALGVAPSDGQVVYAGTASGGLYRSQDGGVNWSRVPSDLEIGIRALAVAPDGADHVYALANWERIYESRDGGLSWQAGWTGLELTTEAISLMIDPLDPSTLYLGADTGLYRSHYGGKNWRSVGRPLDDQTVLTLAARPAPNAEGKSSILYIGATQGAYRSQDSGTTVEPWGGELKNVSVTAFLFDPSDSQTIYAGTAFAGLYRSMDGGETWRKIGPPHLAQEVVEAMAWGPGGELFVASPGGVWAGKE